MVWNSVSWFLYGGSDASNDQAMRMESVLSKFPKVQMIVEGVLIIPMNLSAWFGYGAIIASLIILTYIISKLFNELYDSFKSVCQQNNWIEQMEEIEGGDKCENRLGLHSVDEARLQYEKLCALVSLVNDTFKWAIGINLSLTVASLCLLGYALSRDTIGMDGSMVTVISLASSAGMTTLYTTCGIIINDKVG